MRRFFPIGLLMLLRSPPRGGAIVEFGLVMPFLVLLAVGLFDLGLGLWQRIQVQAAAEAGAQYAALHPDSWDATAIAAAVTSATRASGISTTPTQVCACTNTGTFTQVGLPSLGSCSSLPHCASSGTAGLYAVVSAQVPYSPVIPWPSWVGEPPAAVTAHAYRRLK